MSHKSFLLRLIMLLLVGVSFVVHAQADSTASVGVNSLYGAGKSTTETSSIPALAGQGNPRLLGAGERPQIPVVGAVKSTIGIDGDAPEVAKPLRAQAAKINQFQRFVQESTGHLLPVHGSELFGSPQAYGADTAMPAPAEYILGPGDEVRLQVWGGVDYSSSHTIDRNGQITLPKVGVLMLAGVPVRDLESVLRAQLSKVFANFSLSANVGRLRGIHIYVVGQAQQPGTYALSSLSTLVNALFASGGPSGNGSMRAIELKRGGKTVTTLDLYDFIARGDKSRDVPLLSGDVIVIPPVGPRVAVTGALDQAAIYELKAGVTTVGDILNIGGGVPALASTPKALIERIDSSQTTPRRVQEIALNAKGLAQPLQDGDVLTLLPISPAFANAVTLQGDGDVTAGV